MREYRDGTPLATGSDSAFMSAFSATCYSFSSYVADFGSEHPAARQAAAALIVTILFALPAAALADPGSEASAAAHGAAAALPAMGLYVAPRPGRPPRPCAGVAGEARRHAYRFARRPECPAPNAPISEHSKGRRSAPSSAMIALSDERLGGRTRIAR